jgi:DNA-binding transcriptional MerR regulator
MKRDLNYMKPKKFVNHLTLSELSEKIGRDPRWIRRLEDAGRIPRAQRVNWGGNSVRLWSPAQAKEIKQIIAKHRVGRPRSDD